LSAEAREEILLLKYVKLKKKVIDEMRRRAEQERRVKDM
jgi:hypothetical protein